MAASNFCCTHSQPRTDSPEPPPRPLASIDGIFAAAALPEDHPDALKFPERKPEVNASILRSPNIASKIRQQFRRKSVKNLGKEREYDEDAHRLSSAELLQDVEEVSAENEKEGDGGVQHQRFGGVLDIDKTTPLGSPSRAEVRTSVLKSLGYLKPLLQKPPDLIVSGDSYNIVEVATRVATRREPGNTSKETETPLPVFPKYHSSPRLIQEDLTPTRLRRSRSDCALADILAIPRRQSRSKSDFSHKLQALDPPNADVLASTVPDPSKTPTLRVQEPTATESSESNEQFSSANQTASTDPRATSPSDDSMRLHHMDISQQLRSMSQLSDVPENDLLAPHHQPWSFHHRERFDADPYSARSRHSRQESSAEIDSDTVPLSWGRVRSPFRDTTSSVYSRPTTASPHPIDQLPKSSDARPYEAAPDLNALFADWPLKPSASAEDTQCTLEGVSMKSANSERRNKPLPPTPSDSRKESGSESFVTATNKDEGASVKWLSPMGRGSSVPSKSSSSTLTKASKQSKFLERFSPPKKLVRKRRSIFKFLRPGSRKQQARSISTPVLSVRSRKLGAYDGASDDPALLTVQYELSDRPNKGNRSMSMSQLGTARHSDGASHLTAPTSLQRRPTLADYERNLSVVGDDRRWPSAINALRVKEIQEDDRRESSGLRRRLIRAHPLKDDASPLMAQALEKYQQEKALFRSASKQREGSGDAQPTPVFNSSLFLSASSSLPPLDDHSELLDPLEKGQLARPSARSLSVAHLASPDMTTATASHGSSIGATSKSPSTKPSTSQLSAAAPPSRPSRIGTSLESWSRYPSHTRPERCGSAGRADNVITRDFAVDINLEEINGTDETDPASPDSKRTGKSGGKRTKAQLLKSRSTTFNSIVRYYSNLFTASGFSGQNRRTSITTGGRLEYPELEMVPPQMAVDIPSPTHSSHPGRLTWLKEFVTEEGGKFEGYVRKEEDKFEGFMKKEEHEFEGFARKEEDKLEKFMKKEEGKFKRYVKEEEEKLMHHGRHRYSEHNSTSRDSLFPEKNIFEVEHNSSTRSQRRNTMIAPNDDLEAGPNAVQDAETAHSHLQFDGAAATLLDVKPPTASKAEVWSDIYKECLVRPISTDVKVNARALLDDSATVMPPPALKPIKPRSPEQPKPIDSKATIRRFPSVTVIDDRKGHIRSVSLISVKTSRSQGFDRSSTHDLSELAKAREREECEKLLKGFADVDQTDVGVAS